MKEKGKFIKIYLTDKLIVILIKLEYRNNIIIESPLKFNIKHAGIDILNVKFVEKDSTNHKIFIST